MENVIFGGEYSPERDGNLKDYLKTHNPNRGVFPLFKGPKIYEELWNEGYLEPFMSVVRLMWNVGRGDEHFLVISKDKLNSVQVGFHSGREEEFNYKDIVKDNVSNCPKALNFEN